MKNNSTKLTMVLITTMFASFINPFMLSAVNIALPSIQHQFNCSATALGWIANSFLLANAIVLLPVSKLADTYSKGLMFKLGLYLFLLFSVASALSPNMTVLLVSRVLQGTGAAMMQVTAIALVSALFPPEKRGSAIGINIAAVYTGLSVGPFVGGFLTNTWGWPLIFWTSVPLSLIAIVLAQFTLTEKIERLPKMKFDFMGSVLLALSLTSIIYGGGKIPSLHGWGLFVIGMLLLIPFVKVESKHKSPILNIEILKGNRVLTYSNLAALIHYSATFGVGFLLSLYLQFAKGLSPMQAGSVLVIQPIFMVISAPIAGRLSDKISAGKLATIGMVATLIGIALLSFLNQETSLAYIYAVLVLNGLGFGFFSSPNTNAVMGSVEPLNFSIASGINSSMRVFGQTLSMMIATIVISIFIGKASIGAENLDGFILVVQVSFTVFAVLCVPGIWFSISRNKPIADL